MQPIQRCVAIFLATLLLIPASGEAHHRNTIDRDDLDDDPVEEVPIPLLFAVELDDVVPDYGAPRGGGTREHEGQDFIVPLGTPIISPTEAIVIRTGEGSSAGKYVYTANPGGETFRYMHLDEIADLDPGDKLDVGGYIGTVGDTGNASPGHYHLHFEIRDEDSDDMDPYPRLTESFDLEDQLEFLDDLFRDIRNDEEYAEFLLETFPGVFREALAEGYDLPRDIEDAIEDSDFGETIDLEKRLMEVVAQIPKILTMEISQGDQGAAVILLQIFLIYSSDGPARDRLAAASATGYFGPITAAAVSEYQVANDLPGNGIYNDTTQEIMLAK